MREDKSRCKVLPLLPNPLSNILPLPSFIFYPNRRPQMAKKPITKSQIVSHFAGKFELSKKTASGIIDEVAALAVSETKKIGALLGLFF
jgi:hypothetical protein